MFSVSKIKLYMLVWLACIAVIITNTALITAQDTGKNPKSSSLAPSGSCVPCNDGQITCPSCPNGTKCILTLRSCSECPKARCVKPSPDLVADDEKKNDKNDKILLPAVIGGILGVGFLTAIGYGSFAWRRRTRNERGVKLEGNDEMASLNSSMNIPIRYVPPSTPNTPKPEPTYPRLRVSNISGGTTPLASPLPFNLSDEQLVDVTDDDDTASIAGTILQATTTTTATLMTATRAKPALVRLNTIKQGSNSDISSAKSTRSDNSIPNTPKTPMTGNTFLSAPSISSVPSSPTSNFSIRFGDSDTEQMMPRIDIERPSAESARVTSHSTSHLNSPLLDPIEGRQSFGLFGSDEVYSNDSSLPQLQRESIMSSSSSNGRSTMSSVDGDGEITIFWGGNAPPFVAATGGGGHNQIKESENHVDSTNKDQNKETKARESI